ncbi:MAG: D-alanyl-D-alanine carboxypeptidase/D-alanyl-D-alanine-endopeptidase [Acidobacteria bacterium]|nr:D-alanyl-D-alanine carboxypeptidase/D-alanyl-D-alanine-endopeptidase [Acidobacteriota bacterium]
MLAAALSGGGCVTHAAPRSPEQGGRTASSHRALQQLRADLSRIFGAPIMAHGVWGVDVRLLAPRQRVFELNASKLMMPASNMKIVTLATSADALGWESRVTTSLEAVGLIEGGALRGDLIVRGAGDPTINARNDRANAVFDEWAAALKAAGIREITGRIVGDDQAFEDEGLGSGWAWDYLQYPYAAPSGALQYNEDAADLTIDPGAAPADPVVVALPPGTGLTILNRARTSVAGAPVEIAYRRHLDRPILEITGTVPAGSARLTRSVAVVNPTVFFAHALKEALVSRGIAVLGDAVDLDDVAATMEATGNGPRQLLASTPSPPLREIAAVLMKISQNLYAETLLKTLGSARHGLGTFEGGRRAANATLAAWGLPENGHVIADGSGLSRYNYLSAAMLTTILEHVHDDQRLRSDFMATLPIAGKDGTMASRLKRTRAEGNALVKTGSIANVRAVSGYVRSRDGEMLVFSILANDFVIPAATVNWIADLAIETLANFSRR